ncbi:fimbria/pilus periplasmic chaperone [Citrobacter amalonaticus]|nr:fimbria/pilus periplasmic chaperone [Citrobacter amalonaticus]
MKKDTFLFRKKNTALFCSLGLLMAGMTLMETSATASESATVNTQAFGVSVSPSRVIFPLNGNGATLTIKNPQNYPMLARTTLVGEDRKSAVPFVATPPLFRLDGNQQSQVRIVRTGGDYPADRESLAWACIQGVPPQAAGEALKDEAKKSTSVSVQVSISTCMKMMLRPESLKQSPEDVGGQVTWHQEGNQLVAKNPTAYYLSLAELKVGGTAVKEPEYLAPQSEKRYSLGAGKGGEVSWKVITDYGGNSREFRASLK